MEIEEVEQLILIKSAYDWQNAMFVVGWLAKAVPPGVLEGVLEALREFERGKGRYDVEAAFAERFGHKRGTGS